MLCIDIGNTHIYAGIFDGKTITHRFRINSKQGWSSDQFGVFLRSYFREHELDWRSIRKIAICSVVPSVNYSIRSACIKYFDIDPFFVQQGVKTGLIVNKYKSPHEVGSDIIAGCIAAIDLFPGKNVIVSDLGTGTTIAAATRSKEFCGGVILPGIQTQANSLSVAAEKLSSVTIEKPKSVTGTGTVHAIQSGIYYGHMAAIQTLTKKLAKENFHEEDYVNIGTGGFSALYRSEKLFDLIEPDLIFHGLVLIESMN